MERCKLQNQDINITVYKYLLTFKKPIYFELSSPINGGRCIFDVYNMNIPILYYVIIIKKSNKNQ